MRSYLTGSFELKKAQIGNFGHDIKLTECLIQKDVANLLVTYIRFVVVGNEYFYPNIGVSDTELQFARTNGEFAHIDFSAELTARTKIRYAPPFKPGLGILQAKDGGKAIFNSIGADDEVPLWLRRPDLQKTRVFIHFVQCRLNVIQYLFAVFILMLVMQQSLFVLKEKPVPEEPAPLRDLSVTP